MLDFIKSQIIPVQHTDYILKYWWSWLGHQVVPFIVGYEPAAFIFWIDVPLNNPETHTCHLHHILVPSQGICFILIFAFDL
jgi:hypothetical protein